MVRRIHDLAGDRLPIIGVGGISGPDDALRMLDAGASLVQIYSGLIYQGPGPGPPGRPRDRDPMTDPTADPMTTDDRPDD